MPAKPRVFIGSSAEHLHLAQAIHANLERIVEPTVWSQGVFAKPSEYPLDALLQELEKSDFGVFVLAPADTTISRRRKTPSPRDNAIFEMGMFAGRHGRQRTFFVIPRGEKNKLPSDLLGLIAGEYDPERQDGNHRAILDTACSEILARIASQMPHLARYSSGVTSARLWPAYADRIDELLAVGKELCLFFIHSRSWRDAHADAVKSFLARGGQLRVFLPDAKEPGLVATISAHFDDQLHVPQFIADGYRHFAALAKSYSGQVDVRLFCRYPVYTIYRFDQNSIVALYPNARIRQGVPAFEVLRDSNFGAFFDSDIANIEANDCRVCTLGELEELSHL